MKRKNFEIASGSMADIAFLLLIFFLVSTTIEKDKGYVRNMAAKIEKPGNSEAVHPRNILYVHLDEKDQLMVKGRITDHDQLKNQIREFYISNSPIGMGSSKNPKWEKSEKYPKHMALNEKAIINIHPQKKTSYKSYMEVQSCVQEVVHEVRNEIANHYFGVSYDYLLEHKENEVDRINILHSIVPIRIVDKRVR